MKIYSIYYSAKKDQFKMLDNSFNFYAFLFGFGWLFYHKLWQSGLYFLIALLSIANLQALGIIPAVFSEIFSFLMMLYLGFAGNDMVEADQLKRGHKFLDLVTASSDDEAYIKSLQIFGKIKEENFINDEANI